LKKAKTRTLEREAEKDAGLDDDENACL
jgi:hypothetical protein